MTTSDPVGERSSALVERVAETLWRSAGDDTSVGNDEPMAWAEEHPYCRDSYRQSARAAMREVAVWIESGGHGFRMGYAHIAERLNEEADRA